MPKLPADCSWFNRKSPCQPATAKPAGTTTRHDTFSIGTLRIGPDSSMPPACISGTAYTMRIVA